MKNKKFLALCLSLFLCGLSSTAAAQIERKTDAAPAEDIVRVNTRVVFVDAAVRDGATNQPVRNLAAENFRVLDDGKPRELAYFSRDGDTRRPLSLLIFIDLWTGYGKKYVKQPAAMSRLADALRSLAPEDEVAIMSTWIEEGDAPGEMPVTKVRTISDFTSDRARTVEALHSVPELLEDQEKLLKEISEKTESDIYLEWSLAEISDVVMPQAYARPNRQFVVTALIDDLFGLKRGEREQVAELAARTGITFYGLVYKKSLAGRFFLGALNQVIMRPGGKTIHAADYLAEQTGGETWSVGRADDLASGLEKVISDLAARYSLGFALDDEPADGRMRQLEVRIEAKDARGKKRDLKIRARQNYFVPTLEKQ